jgi:hypothetical protein
MLWFILLVVFIVLMCLWAFLGSYSAPQTGNILFAQRGVPLLCVLLLAILTLAGLQRESVATPTVIERTR